MKGSPCSQRHIAISNSQFARRLRNGCGGLLELEARECPVTTSRARYISKRGAKKDVCSSSREEKYWLVRFNLFGSAAAIT
jgi:hypothetical protein